MPHTYSLFNIEHNSYKINLLGKRQRTRFNVSRIGVSLLMYAAYVLAIRGKTNVRSIKGGLKMTVGDLN